MKPIAKLTVAEIAAPLTETEQNIMIAELCSDLGFTNPAIESYATVSGGLAFPAEFVMNVGEGDCDALLAQLKETVNEWAKSEDVFGAMQRARQLIAKLEGE